MDQPKRAPRAPKERLASVHNKGTRGSRLRQRSPRRPTPRPPASAGASSSAAAAQQQQQQQQATVRCPECGSSDISDVDGAAVCSDCGVTVSDDSNIVAEVTFGENAAGAAIVQGAFVGEGQRHARTQGRRGLHEGRESREVSEMNGRDEIRKQANWHGLSEHIVDQAMSIYKLGLNCNFIQGRQIRVVAAVCLYAACRRDANNRMLLMDFAEGIALNVFKIGQTWTDLKQALFLEDLRHFPVIEVENLIMKFARKLEFGSALMKVAEDAAKLLKRMKRDWMVTGRQPAGLCGACIILAARMNNFRRTVREVVYVVKVADMTVAKRLEEFKRTASSELTVDQFRKHGLLLKKTSDPPALYEQEERDRKKRRKLELLEAARTNNEEPTANATDAAESSLPHRETPRARRGVRRDADGFAIPDIPVDPNLLEQSNPDPAAPTQQTEPSTQRRTRSQKAKEKQPKNPPPLLTEEDLIAEEELEREVESILNDPASIATIESAADGEAAEARAKALAESLRNPSATAIAPVSNDADIGEDEFADDPEVANCLLTPDEQRIKERIWVTHNEDWLRAQQAKALKKALDEASGNVKKPRKRRKRTRMGDGSVLEGGTPVENAADAARRMLEKHAKNPSKHINYANVDRLYAELRGPRSSDGTDGGTRASSAAPSEAGSDVAGIVAEAAARTPSLSVPSATTRNTTTAGGLPTPAATQSQQRRSTRQAAQRGEGGDEEVEVGDGEDEEDSAEGEEDDEETEAEIKRTVRAFGIDDGDFDEDETAGFEYEDGEYDG